MFQNLFRKFGGWTTVMKWHEPWMYRVRLKGDWFPRFALAFAVGSLVTTVLLLLFAINVNPPHPVFAFTGMAIFGGLALMFLVNGQRTAGGRVRLCEEGIIRKRMYAGVSSQWVEEWSWEYSQIPQCAIVPGLSIDKSFSVLMFTDGSDIELIGIPERVNLEEVAQLLAARGVLVRRDVGMLPPEFVRPMGLPMPLIAGAMGLFMLVGGLGFYVIKTGGRLGNEVAAENRHAVRDGEPRNSVEASVPPLQPSPTEEVPGSSLPDTPPPAPSESSESAVPSTPLVPPVAPSVPDSIPPATLTEPVTPEAPTQPNSSREPEPASETPKRPTSAVSELSNAEKTDLHGGTGGAAFEVLSPNQVPIVGFRCRLGSWGGKSAVAKLDPLSERTAPARTDQLIIAREGFVVGGIQVDAEDLVLAVRVVFVKRGDDGVLDKNDYYFSDWIGDPTGGPVKTLGKGTVPVIGVYGRRGLVIDAIGLVLAK